MKTHRYRVLKLALLFSILVFGIIILSMVVISIILIVLYKLNCLDNQNPIFLILYFAIPCMIIGFVFSFIIAIKCLNPIIKMCGALKQVSEGDFNVKFKEKHLIYEMNVMGTCFNTMTKKLSNINLLHSDFISNVSHEFRTPLSTIQGYAELLNKNNLSDEDRIYYSEQLVKVSNKLSEIVKNSLLLSKLEFEKRNILKKQISLAEQLREVIILLETKWKEKNIHFDLEMEEIIFWGNRELLDQAWYNLISNAIKFSNDNDVIRIKLKHKRNSVIVSIIDNGIGMDEETQERIFEKFFQADSSHSEEGTGLGLPLTKKIIDLHLGTIEVRSKLREGTQFIITLPM